MKDSLGLTRAKTIALSIQKDTTPPQLTAPNNFFTAPEGWVEQKTYTYAPYAFDPNGYGVTSMVLKIDGTVVKNHGQLCPDGGCGINPVTTIDVAPYSGGAHKAELIATDGAGNAAKKTWTVNVDPDGQISLGEAEDTLEALEDTTSVNLVGESAAEDREGTGPGMGLSDAGNSLVATGTAVPTEISQEADGDTEMEIANSETLANGCVGGPDEPKTPRNRLSPAKKFKAQRKTSAISKTSKSLRLQPLDLRLISPAPVAALPCLQILSRMWTRSLDLCTKVCWFSRPSEISWRLTFMNGKFSLAPAKN